MVYYHVSRQLHVGDTIYPQQKSFCGWSEFAFNTNIRNYTDFERNYNYLKDSDVFQVTGRTFAKWLCETLFESIRRQRYSNYPTRIYGTFLCKELSESRIFNIAERKGNGTIFIVQTKEPVDFFDMQLFTDAESSLNGVSEDIYNNCLGLAVKYWESKNNESITKKEYICMENLLLREIID